MLKSRTLICLALFPVLAAASGATCWPRRTAVQPPPPVVFQQTPTLEDVIAAVNGNGQNVRQLQTEGATLSVNGLPALRANVALERPRRFRLRAELLQLTGPELDLGSNEELFWLWIKRNPQPAVYFARHDEFAGSPMRRMLPIEPEWLSEAFGLVELDPRIPHEGPFLEGEDRLWIRSRVASPQGMLTKVTVIHPRYGYVLEQHLYDERGGLLARVEGSEHRHYSLEGVTLPHRVRVQLAPGQPTQMAFQLDMSGYRINQLLGETSRLFELPRIEGHPLVNLADPRFQPAGGFLPTAAPAPVAPPGPATATPTAYRTRYRGFNAPEAETRWR